MSDVSILFEDVTFAFRRQPALFSGLNASITNKGQGGKIVALMGPSGVGKTTFCDLALGLQTPKKGSVSFLPRNTRIASIPQRAVIFEELSVVENVSCLKHSKTLGSSFDPQRVEPAIEHLGLSDILKSGTLPAQLSGGEAQRLMLARIRTIDCSVLILDEPCSFLDNRVKGAFLEALQETVKSAGMLALMVTHIWAEARTAADEVAFFHKSEGGSVSLYSGTIRETETAPPTIDAFFAIHWPNCYLIQRDEGNFPASPLYGVVPASAEYAAIRTAKNDHSEVLQVNFYDESELLIRT